MIVKPNESVIINGIRFRAGDEVPDPKPVYKAPAEPSKAEQEAHLKKFVSTYVINNNKPKKKDISNV